jgi:hypothetical protein
MHTAHTLVALEMELTRLTSEQTRHVRADAAGL